MMSVGGSTGRGRARGEPEGGTDASDDPAHGDRHAPVHRCRGVDEAARCPWRHGLRGRARRASAGAPNGRRRSRRGRGRYSGRRVLLRLRRCHRLPDRGRRCPAGPRRRPGPGPDGHPHRSPDPGRGRLRRHRCPPGGPYRRRGAWRTGPHLGRDAGTRRPGHPDDGPRRASPQGPRRPGPHPPAWRGHVPAPGDPLGVERPGAPDAVPRSRRGGGKPRRAHRRSDDPPRDPPRTGRRRQDAPRDRGRGARRPRLPRRHVVGGARPIDRGAAGATRPRCHPRGARDGGRRPRGGRRQAARGSPRPRPARQRRASAPRPC